MSESETVFDRFAERELHGASPLYEELSTHLAADDDLLALAAEAPDSRSAPELLLAAVQSLLFERPDHPLAAYYPSISEAATPPDDEAYDHFREFCLSHDDEIARLVSTRRVQPNVIRRSSVLLPAFEYISKQCNRTPLGLVDVGARAGLNLLWDRYGYEYPRYGRYGDPDSPVQVSAGVLGQRKPPFPAEMPPVGTRLGIDLHPLDVRDDDDARWLRALVWPERDEWHALTEGAISIARQHPPELVEGDALVDLPDVCERVPGDETLCLFNTYLFHEITVDQQDELVDTVETIAADRDLFWLWVEPSGSDATVLLSEYTDGEEETEVLATCDTQGRWLEWRDEMPEEAERASLFDR